MRPQSIPSRCVLTTESSRSIWPRVLVQWMEATLSHRTHPASPGTARCYIVHRQIAFLKGSFYSCRRLGSELLSPPLMCCQADVKWLELTEGKDYASVMTLMRPERALWGFWVRDTVSASNVFSTDLQTWMNSPLVNLVWGSNCFNIFITPVVLWNPQKTCLRSCFAWHCKHTYMIQNVGKVGRSVGK